MGGEKFWWCPAASSALSTRDLPISDHQLVVLSLPAPPASGWLFPLSVHCTGLSVWPYVHNSVSCAGVVFVFLFLFSFASMISQINAKTFYSLCATSLLLF